MCAENGGWRGVGGAVGRMPQSKKPSVTPECSRGREEEAGEEGWEGEGQEYSHGWLGDWWR